MMQGSIRRLLAWGTVIFVLSAAAESSSLAETGERALATSATDLAERWQSGELGFRRLLVIERHSIEPSHVYTYHNEGFRPGGGLLLLTPNAKGGELERLVESPTGQILDADLSHDGETILFSWRKNAKDTYHVYRIGVDGRGLRRITDGCTHNFNACWLPDGGIAFLSTRRPAYAYCWTSPVGVLHRMDSDGTNVRQLSANYLNDFTPSVTSDGLVVYGRWEYVDRPAIPIQSLWTIRPDGTGLSVFYGNRVLSPATFIEPRSIPGTSKILCTMTAHNGPCRGAIGIIDPSRGVNAQASIRNLTPEVDIGRVDRGAGNRVRGPYESPFPIDDKYFLVSRSGTILLRDYDGTELVEVLASNGPLGFYSPQPLRSRAVPPVRRMTLRETGESRETDEARATVFLRDVYDGLEPQVERGEVRQICVVQEVEKSVLADVKHRAFGFQFPVVSCGATYAPKKVWGYADVDDDGSACFEVPAGVPIYFMALDEHGRAVQRMRSFTHLMPGEVQSCSGCHVSRNDAGPPPSSSPTPGREPQELTRPEWGEGGFSYLRIVQPVLDRHCVRCHNALEAPKGVDLSGDLTDFFNVSYETLARQGPRPGANPYTKWIPTYNGQEANILAVDPKTWGSPVSRLADLILSGHPDESGKPRVDVDDASRRRVFAWIDLNVPYYGTSTSRHLERRGCRQMKPAKLDAVLEDVMSRRCVSCHDDSEDPEHGVPQKSWVRISRPEHNSFLLAPLARDAGGTEACGEATFRSKDDPDYRAILACFDEIHDLLERRPRMDMLAASVRLGSEALRERSVGSGRAASRGPSPRGVDLASLDGWDIVVPGTAGPAVHFAAEELQNLFERASGHRLPIVRSVDRPDRHVFVGCGDDTQRSVVGFGVDDLGEEDLRIVIRDENIAIAGGGSRGTLYGVYTFLEDYLGVRFLTTDHTHVPEIGKWKVVGPVDRVFRPPFAMRWSYYGEINRDPTFAARRRVNTVASDAKLGGKTGLVNINHSFLRQIPSQEYGKEHPDYYCWIDGERLANVESDAYGNEPCLSHPDVLRIVTEAVLREIERHPERANVSVSQNDNDKYCRCEKCAAVDAREGTPMGSLLTFVNAVAAQVAKKHPKVKVGTLSYWYSRRPPKTIRPAENVQIQLCSIECCLIHAIDDPTCPKNAEFCRDLRGWGEISDDISIWNYNTNFSNYLLPCPNLRVIGPNVRFFVANRAKGIFMQAAGNARSAELADLRNYLISGLIWDPSRDPKRLIDEFLALHYGRAAEPIARYIRLIHDTAEASGVHRRCFASRALEYGLDESVAPKALALFEEALGLARGEEERARVEKASIAAYRLAIDPVWQLKDASKLNREFAGRMRPLVSRFLELCGRHGVDRAAEHVSFATVRDRLRGILKSED